MRIGENPNKSYEKTEEVFIHQVIIPVYIPNLQDYFKDALKILKCNLNSLFLTASKNTFVTVVNNGSCKEVQNYLEDLFTEKSIHELINTSNIGKTNAIVKGLQGHYFDLITIADADVLFLSNWQIETYKIFNEFEKAGVVGLVPQIKLFSYNSYNTIFDNFFSKKLTFKDIINPEAIRRFYKSVGWDDNFNQNFLKKHLVLTSDKGVNAVVGSAHFVATYRRDALKTYSDLDVIEKLSPRLDKAFLDNPVLKIGGWRLTTENNFAFHMGNTYEEWMGKEVSELENCNKETIELKKIVLPRLKTTRQSFFVKNRLFKKVFSLKAFKRWFYKFKGLPNSMINKY